MSESYTISELAREFDITTRTIRFYEDKKLLKPQRVGNTRVYSRRDRTRLRLILRGKRLGWPLGDIGAIIHLYDSTGGEQRQLEAMIERLRETRETLLEQQEDLNQLLGEIEVLERNCHERLDSARNDAASADNGISASGSAIQKRQPH